MPSKRITRLRFESLEARQMMSATTFESQALSYLEGTPAASVIAAQNKSLSSSTAITSTSALSQSGGSLMPLASSSQGAAARPPKDNKAPTIANVATSNLTATGVTISWTTDEASTTQVEYGKTSSLGTSSALDSTLVINHSVSLGGLQANTLYYYRVKSKDAAGNLRNSSTLTFTTPALADTTAPVLVGPVQTSNLTSSSVTIAWTTNEAADTQVEYGLTTAYGSSSSLAPALTANHTVNLANLQASALYHYRVRSRDAAGNLMVSQDLTFTTQAPADTTAPVLVGPVQTSNLTPTGVTINWTTNEASDTQVEYGPTTSYGSSSPTATALVTNHSVNLANLQASTLYHYRVKSRDAAGNLLVSADLTFTTPAPPDTTAPVLVGAVQTSNLIATGVTVGWTTNEASDTQVEYGPTTAYGSSSTLAATLTTGHSVNLTSLQPNTLYHYRVKSRDAAGNLFVSTDLTFTTPVLPDGTPPVIFAVSTTKLNKTSVTIHWSTDQIADGQVEYGINSVTENRTAIDGAMIFNHSAQLSNLQGNTTYLFRVKSRDATGNLTTSQVFTLTTLETAISPATEPPRPLRVVPEGFAQADQYVIPQFADGASGPAGQVIGWGIDSILGGTLDTQNQLIKAIVVTEGWTDSAASVRHAVLRDVAILGYDDTNPYDAAIYGTNGSVSDYQVQFGPYEHAADLYQGALVKADGAVLDNLHLFYVPGTALTTQGTVITPTTVLTSERANLIRDISVKRAYRGLDIVGGVNVIENVDITEVRDYSMRLAGGVNQLENIHTYAGDIGLWAASGQTSAELLYLEQSAVGLKIDANQSSFSQIFSHTNRDGNIVISGNANRITDFTLEVMAGATGFRIGTGAGTARDTTLENGVAFLGSNSVGIRLAADGSHILNTAFHGQDGATNRVALRAESVINDSVIVIDVSNVELGLDLNFGGTSKLGRNNAIWITGFQVGQMANLPATWDASNKIFINGVLQSGGNAYGAKATSEALEQIVAASTAANDAPALPVDPSTLLVPVNIPTINTVPGATAPTGSLVVKGTIARDQHVLPTFADGDDAPAGQLIGEGVSTSRLVGTLNTKNQAIPSIVVTEHYGEDMSEWYNGTYGHPEYASAVLYAHVRDLTIAGYDDTAGNYGAGGSVSANPQLGDTGKPDLYDGLRLQGNGTFVSDVKLTYIPGTALVSSRPANARPDQSNPMDRTEPIMRDIAIERAYRGMHLLNVDQFVNNVSVGWVRDYGIKLENSAAQLQHIHTYGSGAVGVWAASGPNWGNDLLLEDTTVGLKIDASSTAFTEIVSRNHSARNIEITGATNIVSDFELEVSSGAVGLEISGHLNQIDDGTIELAGASTGIHLTGLGGSRVKITNTTIQGTGAVGQVGIRPDSVLNDAVIVVDVSDLALGIDLNADGWSHIGKNNLISISGVNVAKLANLPASWDPSNRIYLNGVLV